MKTTAVADDRIAMLLFAVLALGRRLRAERPQGSVTLSALSILGTVGRLGPLPAARLAVEERLQPQSLTRIVVGLERHGLIRRTRSAADRRALAIVLTARGRRVLDEDLALRRRWLTGAMAGALDDGERDRLFAATPAMVKLALDGPA